MTIPLTVSMTDQNWDVWAVVRYNFSMKLNKGVNLHGHSQHLGKAYIRSRSQIVLQNMSVVEK